MSSILTVKPQNKLIFPGNIFMQIDPKVLVEYKVVVCTGSLLKYLVTCHFTGELDRQYTL